jgi:tetratricopeptide (TPR) repeat protein
MLSLGNLYFSYSANGKSESQLKESYKFFYHVLNENNSNAYAANGLGMVCYKKNELDVAREIFTKAREANVPKSEDICINLAHVYVLQGRLLDAERLYQATIKNISRIGRSFSDKPAYLNECVANAQQKHGRMDESASSMWRAIHLNPTNLRFWYNVAFVRMRHSSDLLARGEGGSTAAVLDDSRTGLYLAKKIFKNLCSAQHPQTQSKHGISARPYEKKLAAINSSACSVRAFLTCCIIFYFTYPHITCVFID